MTCELIDHPAELQYTLRRALFLSILLYEPQFADETQEMALA
jgi:hypothetical protein